jgi:chromosome segregation ATPase
MSDKTFTISPSEAEMIAWNAGYRAAKQEAEAEAAKWSAASLEWNAKMDEQAAEIAASALALEEGTRHSIALQAEVAKWKEAAEAWTVMVDEQALQIHNLQMDKISLQKQIKGLYDAIDEARDEHARLSNELLDAVTTATKAREVMEKFADDLESSKYTVLIGQELRNRWKTAMNSDLAINP